MREVFTFESEVFNSTQMNHEWVNPDCFGEDVAHALAEQLRALGAKVDEPWCEDWGWEFDVEVDESVTSVQVTTISGPDGLPTGDDPTWCGGFVPRKTKGDGGFFKRLFKRPMLTAEAVTLVHQALQQLPITDLAWYDGPEYSRGVLNPFPTPFD